MNKKSIVWSKTAQNSIRTLSLDGSGDEIEENVRDISVSADGTVWIVTNDPVEGSGDTGGGAIKFKKPKGKKWETVADNGAAKIDGGPKGAVAYAISGKGEVIRVDTKGGTTTLAGEDFAREVSVGADGTAWVISNQAIHGGGAVHYLNDDDHWVRIPAEYGAQKVTATPDGRAYIIDTHGILSIVSKEGEIEQKSGEGFAKEISVAPDGSLWVITNEPVEGGGNLVICQAKEGEPWQEVEGGALLLDAGFA